MHTTKQFLRLLAHRYASEGKLASDYRLAKIMDLTQGTLSHYRTGRGSFSDDTALKVAELLQVDQGYVLACIHAERAKRDTEKAAWSKIAERFSVAAMLLIALWGAGQVGGFDLVPVAEASGVNTRYTLYAIAAAGLALWAAAARRAVRWGQDTLNSPEAV